MAVVDHLALAYDRYQEKRGGSLAGATTFFAFLSFFPLVALAFSVAGYAAAISPHAADWLRTAIQSVLPGLASQLPLDSIARRKGRRGNSRSGRPPDRRSRRRELRPPGAARHLGADGAGGRVGGVVSEDGNVLVQKAWDTAVLVALGLCLILSAAATTLAVPAARGVLGVGGTRWFRRRPGHAQAARGRCSGDLRCCHIRASVFPAEWSGCAEAAPAARCAACRCRIRGTQAGRGGPGCAHNAQPHLRIVCRHGRTARVDQSGGEADLPRGGLDGLVAVRTGAAWRARKRERAR